MSPSTTPATQSAVASRATSGDQARHQTQPGATSATPATRKLRWMRAKCHAWDAKRQWMSPSATPGTQSPTASRVTNDNHRQPSTPPDPAQCHNCHACHAKRRWVRASARATPAMQTAATSPLSSDAQARYQSQPSALSAAPATQSEGGCRQVPCRPRKVKVDDNVAYKWLCMTKLCERLCVCQSCVWKIACEKIVCEKLCGQSCVWKNVCDKVVCEISRGTKLCMTKLCVCACVCVWQSCVWKKWWRRRSAIQNQKEEPRAGVWGRAVWGQVFGQFLDVPECVAKGSRFTLGLGVGTCSLDVASAPATVGNHRQWGRYGRANGKFPKSGHLWKLQTSRNVALFHVAGVALCDIPTCFKNASKIVFCGRRNTLAPFPKDEMHFSCQAQHFGELHRNFAWQTQHFRCVVLRVFCESHWQGRGKWWQSANSVANMTFCEMRWGWMEAASHKTSAMFSEDDLSVFEFGGKDRARLLVSIKWWYFENLSKMDRFLGIFALTRSIGF